jgi:hypothetical protein
MQKRIIGCASCGRVIGYYPVFSHRYDEEDTGCAEYNEDYGGGIEGDYYCIHCYPEAIRRMIEEQDLLSMDNGGVKNMVEENGCGPTCPHGKKQKIRLTSIWPGTSRGWGPITRKLEWEWEELCNGK